MPLGILRNFWEDAKIVTTLSKLSSNVGILDFYHHWDKILLTGLKVLITLKTHFATNNPSKVNDEFLKKIMNSVKDKLVDKEELLEDEDLFSCV